LKGLGTGRWRCRCAYALHVAASDNGSGGAPQKEQQRVATFDLRLLDKVR